MPSSLQILDVQLPRPFRETRKIGARGGSLREVDGWKETVASYYNAKTAALLKKYGPGPRVHYHMGLFAGHFAAVADPTAMRQRLVKAQEALLIRAAGAWQAERTFTGDVLDVGCGLGGGSIFWAQHYGARVTSVTVAKDHIPVIARFASDAGVADRVRPILAEACEVPADRAYDTAVAVESSCYFDRDRWFKHLAKLIRPGGYVCIEDIFQLRSGGTALWDSYFHARAGSVAQYADAAKAAGFELDVNIDVTAETPEFWVQSMGWIDAVLSAEPLTDVERHRLQKSRKVHAWLYQEWIGGGLEVRLLRFRRVR